MPSAGNAGDVVRSRELDDDPKGVCGEVRAGELDEEEEGRVVEGAGGVGRLVQRVGEEEPLLDCTQRVSVGLQSMSKRTHAVSSS